MTFVGYGVSTQVQHGREIASTATDWQVNRDQLPSGGSAPSNKSVRGAIRGGHPLQFACEAISFDAHRAIFPAVAPRFF